ncbi:MAG: hypothetical protein JWN04_3101 [Myxococcaceae bacterium]|nr:hypothetical protein [Myxococcaceae bacterium]
MWSNIAIFVLAGLNPFAGLFMAVPFAIFKMEWPPWLAVVTAVPLAFAQVIVVDVLWERLIAWPWFRGVIEKRRNEKMTNLLARDDAKLWLSILGVWAGPWLVTAFARFAGHSVGRVALPMLFGLTYIAVGTAAVCKLAPQLFE